MHEEVVGDIALLKLGKIIPCNSVFLLGHNVKCDESRATGKPDVMKKVLYKECLVLRNKAQEGGARGGNIGHTNCFEVSGSKVLEGVGSYIMVAVGMWSFNGRIMMGNLFSCNT